MKERNIPVPPGKNEHLMTRRELFKYLLLNGTVLVGAKTLGDRVEEGTSDNQKTLHNDKPSVLSTVKDSVLFDLSQHMILLPVVNTLGIKTGNASFQQKDNNSNVAQKYSKREVLKACAHLIPTLLVGAPIVEEFVFRAIPDMVTMNIKGPRWEIGTLSSAIFALVHNIVVDKKTGKNKLDLKILPLFQFTNGLFFWKMMVERGYLHAVISHSVVNTLAFPNAFIKKLVKSKTN